MVFNSVNHSVPILRYSLLDPCLLQIDGFKAKEIKISLDGSHPVHVFINNMEHHFQVGSVYFLQMMFPALMISLSCSLILLD